MVSKKKINAKPLTLIIEKMFFICACISILSLLIITVYLFISGGPPIFKIGFFNFLFGMEWNPEASKFGILPMITSSLLATLGSVIIGVVVGLFVAIFLAEIGPKWLVKPFSFAIELLAGIPSVVFGFFGLIVIVPLIYNNLGQPISGGLSLLAVIIILSIMILPTIINISETSIRAVRKEYKEGSLALGASHIQTIFKVLIPAAKSGIFTGIVLGIGRAIGETMAVILVAGNSVQMPTGILSSVRTLTSNIALEMGYSADLHREALFATGVVLFTFIMILNILLNVFIRNRRAEL